MDEDVNIFGNISVTDNFLKIGKDTTIKVSEIKRLQLINQKPDWHVTFSAWVVTFFSFVIWIAGPVHNAPLIPVVIGLVAFSLYKQMNPKPIRHMVMVGTGGFGQICVCNTDDGEMAQGLRDAIELAMQSPTSA